ncbi:MAG: hypothetical protein WAN72_26500 [Candidatus Acidiferrales bacterium]
MICAITPRHIPVAESVESTALGIEPDVGIMREHLGRDVTSDCHHGLVAGLGFGKLSDGVMAKVMEAQPGQRTLDLVNIRTAFLVAALVGWVLEQTARRA